MQNLMTPVLALQFASLISLAGTLGFAAFVTEPAFRSHAGGQDATAFRARLALLIWASLVVGILSGLLWLILEARSMSGKSIGDVFSQGLLGTVLTRTRFGRDLELRGLFAVPLVFCLILAGRRPRSGRAKPH